MALVSFQTLWDCHPATQVPPLDQPCLARGKPTFTNQCAIRMGACFVDAGIALTSYRGAFCWYGHGRKHTLRAEEMKLWLDSPAVSFVGQADISKKNKRGIQASHVVYNGRTGIVMFRNFWGPPSYSGDHIDLWDGSQMTHGDSSYFARSAEIWFWDMQ